MRSCVSVDTASVTYDVVHTTSYHYTESVSVSHHVAHLSPRALPHQACLSHQLQIEPVPAVTTRHVDYFGNVTTFFAMQGAHTRLTVRARSQVAVRAAAVSPSDTPPWERALERGLLPLEAIECAFDTVSSRAGAELSAYTRPSFPPRRPLLEAVADLTRRVHEDFTFDPEATTIATPLMEVFRSRRGVCQDFARVQIACLRSLGLPAHYVSGYLETVPPPGKPRLVGADASHAWLAVYCPGLGWIDADPTNNMLPANTHVTLAWGRDYTDVSPIRGVILGGGEHSLRVQVDIIRQG
jgi:transglutaminase-like putative cysteine protease